MNDSTYRISLDINEHGTQVVLNAKLSDTGRKIYITLRAGGTPYPIADDCYAVFAATKPDGSILYNACTIENNEIIYEFTGQTCSAVGRIRCEIKLNGKDEKLITSPRFALLVDGTVYPDGRLESQDEFSALTQMVSDTLTTQALAREAANDAKSATNTANIAAENANEAAKKANDAASNLICDTDEKYFAIDYDGVVSLKPEYRDAIPLESKVPVYSDNGAGVAGSRIAELPEVVVIPDVIGTTAVSALADGMFQYNKRVKSVTIPNSTFKIPIGFANEAFHLEEVKGTDNVEVIGNGAFLKCGIKKALFPKLKSFEGTNNFNYAVNLTIVDIGNTVTTIPKHCFNGCESLSLVLGGAVVTNLEEGAFKTTRSLKNLPLLSNVRYIKANAFLHSRVDYDWWNASFPSVGTNGTPAKYNTNKWWNGCTYKSRVNPLGSTFSQYNPAWRDVMLGQSNKTYEYGCVEISAAHIYSALTGVTFDSPEVFINDIVGSIDNGRLLELTGGKTEYEGVEMEAWLSALGLVCERIPKEDGGYNSTSLQKVYDALAQGALIFTGGIDAPSVSAHVSVIYGVAENGEMLVLDSNSFKYTVGVYEAGTFQQPIWSFVTEGTGFMIVRKGE